MLVFWYFSSLPVQPQILQFPKYQSWADCSAIHCMLICISFRILHHICHFFFLWYLSNWCITDESLTFFFLRQLRALAYIQTVLAIYFIVCVGFFFLKKSSIVTLIWSSCSGSTTAEIVNMVWAFLFCQYPPWALLLRFEHLRFSQAIWQIPFWGIWRRIYYYMLLRCKVFFFLKVVLFLSYYSFRFNIVGLFCINMPISFFLFKLGFFDLHPNASLFIFTGKQTPRPSYFRKLLWPSKICSASRSI